MVYHCSIPIPPQYPFILRVIFLVLSLAVFLPNQAQGRQYPLWEVGLGGVLLYMPDYRGADESRGHGFMFPYVIYRGDTIKVDRESIRGLLFKTDRLKLDFSLHGSVPVDSSKNKARQGMPNLDPTFEIGPSLEVILIQEKKKGYKLSLNIPGRAVFSANFLNVIPQGWTFSPRLNFDFFERKPKKGWGMGMSFGPVFGDHTVHEYFYGVDKGYASTQRSAYSAPGGYGGLQLTASLGKNFDKLWLGFFTRVDFLQGAAFSNSPLVKTNTSFLTGFAVSYFFWESKTTVEADK